MIIINEKSIYFNKRIKVNFNGGDLTGDADILLYKEFDDAIDLSREIEENIKINDSISHQKHGNHDVIMQNIYQNAVGYHADDHADDLKYDPPLTMILNKPELASQPTLSRLNQNLDKGTMKAFQAVNRILIDRYHELKTPKRFVLDIDSLNSPTYGD